MFLDNLFPNITIAHALLAVGFAIIDTTRKNAAGLPLSLTAILAKDKEAKKDTKKNNRESNKKKKKQPLAYNSVLAVVINYCLCFL